jgi:hypothetical protein
VAQNVYRFGPKDPATVNEPFTFDLTAWCRSKWTITCTVTCAVSPNDMTVDSVVYAGSFVTAYLSGGTAGVDYTVTINVPAVDTNGNSRGPVGIGAMVLCLSPVPAQ